MPNAMYAPLLTHLLLHADAQAAAESDPAATAPPPPSPPSAPPQKMPGKALHPQLLLPTNLEQLVDHFTPLGTLGRGNMGTVFLVVSNYMQKLQVGGAAPFALKVTRSLSSKKQRSHVEREILSSLHHPFLQTLHAHFEFGDHSLLLLDLCAGGDLNSLRHRQPEKRFSETAARFYAAEVLVALEHLHKLGIVYRDLKPENILVQANGHIKLTDFDLSLRLGPAGQATNLQAQLGRTRPPTTASTLQQHIVAEADSEKAKKGLKLYARRGIAFTKKCRAREPAQEAPKGGSMSVGGGEAVYTVSIPRVRAAKQTCNLCRLQCLGLNGKESARRRQKFIGAAGTQCVIGPKEFTKHRKVNRGSYRPGRRMRSCLPGLQSKRSKAPREAEESYICVVGTDEYVAPEVLRGEDHGFSMDWWSFGIFLYEMIYGCTPFKGSRSGGTLCNILEKEPDFPGMKTPAKHLIAQLLVKDPSVRLGTVGGADDIKRHPFFGSLNWDSLPYICRPPFIPRPLCLSELEERYSAKLKARRSDAGMTHREVAGEERQISGTCKSWLDELVENIEAADNIEHTSSTQYSHSSSSAGFLSSSADGADRELQRDEDVDAIFSSAEWSSELEAGKHTPLVRC